MTRRQREELERKLAQTRTLVTGAERPPHRRAPGAAQKRD